MPKNLQDPKDQKTKNPEDKKNDS